MHGAERLNEYICLHCGKHAFVEIVERAGGRADGRAGDDMALTRASVVAQ